MSKKHFVRAAEIVRAILDGNWTNEPPQWFKGYTNAGILQFSVCSQVRAVQTAEAFIILAQEFNPRFDVNRFLVACGLVDVPAKPSKRKAKVA